MADYDDALESREALIEKAEWAVRALESREADPSVEQYVRAVLDAVADDRALLDALAAEKARVGQAEADLRRAHAALTHENQLRVNAEAALSRVLADVEALGALVDGITDTDGGKWIPCADVLALVAEHRDRA